VTFDEALAAKKLRVSPTTSPTLAPRLYALVRARLERTPGSSQDELLDVTAVEPVEGGARVTFTWVFDHDFASQYDQTEAWRGVASLGAVDVLEVWESR
jgi:hypothetical protein